MTDEDQDTTKNLVERSKDAKTFLSGPDNPVLKEIYKRLESEEKVVFATVPKRNLVIRKDDVFPLFFGFFFSGFAILSILAIATQTPDGWFKLLVLFFNFLCVLIGLHLSVGHILLRAKKRRHTAYCVTDKRVLVLSTWPTKQFNSFSGAKLGDVRVSGNSKIGHIILASVPAKASNFLEFILIGDADIGLLDVERPQDLHLLIAKIGNTNETKYPLSDGRQQ